MKNRIHRHTFSLFGSLTLCCVLSINPIQAQTTGTWTYTGTTLGNLSWGYSNATTPSWASNTIPSGVGHVANFTANITAAKTITLDGTRTVGKLVIADSDSSHAYTLAAGTSGILAFDATDPASATLSFPSNVADAISAPITLNDNLRVYSTSTTISFTKSVNGIISGSGRSITFDNDDGVTLAAPLVSAGQFNMNGANTFSGGVTIDDVRVTTTNAAGYGTGTVTVLDGACAFINGTLTVGNNFAITGNGWQEAHGHLGAIRMANVTLNGTITVAGTPGNSGGTAPDSSLFPLTTSSTAVSAIANGVISGGDLLLGSMSAGGGTTAWTGNETLTINAANTYGDSIVRPADVPTSGQITLSVGGATTNTTATLGSGNVYLHGGVGGKIAALRIWRGGGYTMQQDVITSSAPGTKTAFIADVIGTGLTLNGKSIQLTEQLRLGGNANGAILNIDAGSTLSAGQFFTGHAANNSTTVHQTGGTVTVSGEIKHGNFPTETSVWNMSGGSLTLTGLPTSNPYFTSGTTEDTTGKGTLYIGVDGQGIFNQSAGSVSAAAVVLDNRSNSLAGTNMTTGIDQYNLNGGLLNLGFAGTNGDWGIQGNASSEFVFGGGKLNANTALPIAVAMVANGTGSEIDTKGFTVTLKSGISGTGTLNFTDSTSTTGKIVFDLASNASVSAALASTIPVEKIGSGLLTMGTASIGSTTATAGGLRLNGTLTGNATVDGASLWTGGSLVGNLSIAPTTNSSISYGGSPIAVTGNVTFGAASLNTVNLTPGLILTSGTYPLITYTGSLSGGLANLQLDPVLVSQYRQTFGLVSGTNSIDLTVTGSNLALTWNGIGSSSGTWDNAITSTWMGSEKFYVNDAVTFNDSAASGSLGNAEFTSNLGNSIDNDLIFTAKASGVGGEAVSIKYVAPTDPDQTLSVSVVGSAITVNLATDSLSFVTSTSADVKAAIEANASANALITVANAGIDNGTGLVAAMAESFLDLVTAEMVSIPSSVVVSPSSMTFANNALDYEIDGPGTIGGIGSLLKSGKGKVTIYSGNSFSGGTIISKGELVAGVSNALGTGSITFGDVNTLSTDSCTLSLATGPLSLANPTITVADTCLNARISSTGGTISNTSITKRGTGYLTIGHPTVNSTTTNYITGTSSVLVEQGNIAFSSMSAMANNTPVTLGNSNSGSVNTVLEMPVNGSTTGDAVTLTPAITLGTLGTGDTSQAILRYVGAGASGAAASLAGTANLNGRDLYLENTSHITGIPPFGTNARLCNYTLRISGTGDVHVRCGTNIDGSFNATPRCRITNASNDWIGDLYVDTGMVQIGNGSATTALTAIPNTSVIRLSAGTRLGLGGASETVAGLVGGGASGSLPAAIINNNTGGGGLSTLTLSGSGDYVYDGTIADETSTRGFAIVKSGSGTQTFNGPGSYTGINNGATPTVATTSINITGGTVAVGHDTALGTGAVNLNSATGTLRSADTNARTLANPVTYSTNFTLGSATTGDLLFTGPVNMGGGNKEFNVLNARTEFSGIMSGTLTPVRTKKGPGTLVFSGANTYPGSTVVSEGTLELKGGSQASSISVSTGASLGFVLGSPTSSSSTFDLTAGTIKITGTPTLASYTLISSSAGITGTPVLDAPIAGYALKVVGNTLVLEQAGYSSWASLNGATADRSADHDNDGVANGIEFFIGGTSGNTTGFTALPPIVKELDGSYSVTWTKAATYSGVYGTDYVVETSATLNGDWATEASPGTVAITSNNVKFTFPGGPAYSGKNFVRLKVTGP